MTFKTIKDPQEVLDYKIDWADVMAASDPADTISTSTWAADAGVTVDSSSNTTTTATVWISGGTLGETSLLVNTIVTAAGRTHERTINVEIKQQ